MKQGRQQSIADYLYTDQLAKLKQVVPDACAQDLAEGIIGLINKHIRPLDDPQQQAARIGKLIARYTSVLSRRMPNKRPRTKAGALKSLEAFVTKDIRTTAREYSTFEAQAEKALIDNPAMHLTSLGIERHHQRAIDIIGRFMHIIAEQTEQLSRFRCRIQKLENEYFDCDNWALHLHDRINRLANLLTSIDAAATSLKRAIINNRPFARALESLRAIRDDSLDPLEFIDKVFSGHDYPYTIHVASSSSPLHYSNHFLIREILLELVHNAIANNASSITITLERPITSQAHIDVVDDCPGGMPPELIKRIGRERILDSRAYTLDDLYHNNSAFSRGWGLYAVCNNMIPRLGTGASIDFISPLTPQGGTRIRLTVPLIRSAAQVSPTSTHPAESAPNMFSLHSVVASGCALASGQFHAVMHLPFHADASTEPTRT